MYLIESRTGEQARACATERRPFGPAFPEEIVRKTDKLEVWGSSFSDSGEDFCLFRALDASGKLVAEVKTAGY